MVKEKNFFKGFEKKHSHLVCVDSDGCVMDTMDIKHFRCFGPEMVKEWGLDQEKEKLLAAWNRVNLYSMTRGVNRFKALYLVLKEYENENGEGEGKIEGLEDLKKWIETSPSLSNEKLKEAGERQNSIFLKKACRWSETVNRKIEQLPQEVKQPFDGVKHALERIHREADVVVVSSANPEAVRDEWQHWGLLEYVDMVLAQDAGSKAKCIERMLSYGYNRENVLMVGDAPGDLEAARMNAVCFYPILTGRETESWERLEEEEISHFLKGQYAGNSQQEYIRRFEANLGGGTSEQRKA